MGVQRAPLHLEREEGRGQLGIWRQGAGSVAVEHLRSLERQTESLTASQNNPARVRFPGGSSRQWGLDEGRTCNGVWQAGLGLALGVGRAPASVPGPAEMGSPSACPGFICTTGRGRGSLIHPFGQWRCLLAVRDRMADTVCPFKATLLGSRRIQELACVRRAV